VIATGRNVYEMDSEGRAKKATNQIKEKIVYINEKYANDSIFGTN
jgi:hypothetical protein